ncbi:hypothetical protein LTS17_008545 [Exophiala oligosperma]
MLDLKLALSLFHTFFTYYFATLVLFFVLRNVGQLDINLIQQYHVRVVNTIVRIVQRLLDDLSTVLLTIPLDKMVSAPDRQPPSSSSGRGINLPNIASLDLGGAEEGFPPRGDVAEQRGSETQLTSSATRSVVLRPRAASAHPPSTPASGVVPRGQDPWGPGSAPFAWDGTLPQGQSGPSSWGGTPTPQNNFGLRDAGSISQTHGGLSWGGLPTPQNNFGSRDAGSISQTHGGPAWGGLPTPQNIPGPSRGGPTPRQPSGPSPSPPGPRRRPAGPSRGASVPRHLAPGPPDRVLRARNERPARSARNNKPPPPGPAERMWRAAHSGEWMRMDEERERREREARIALIIRCAEEQGSARRTTTTTRSQPSSSSTTASVDAAASASSSSTSSASAAAASASASGSSVTSPPHLASFEAYEELLASGIVADDDEQEDEGLPEEWPMARLIPDRAPSPDRQRVRVYRPIMVRREPGPRRGGSGGYQPSSSSPSAPGE